MLRRAQVTDVQFANTMSKGIPMTRRDSGPNPLRPDASELLAQLQSGSLSAEQLLRAQLARLAEVQPLLNGATQIFSERASAEARQPQPGALSGLPCSVKETFGLAGETVTAGSLR